MALALSILGCNSAIPTMDRLTTSQALSSDNKIYLIDCGEGVQIRLNQLKIKKNKIHEVFISHLHGDHFFGLPGLITSLNLSGRTIPLKIYGPVGLQHYVETLSEIGALYLNYDLDIIEISTDKFQQIHEDSNISVFSFPLKHRIPTTGFLFKEKDRLRNINPESISKYALTFEEIKLLKNGADIHRPDESVIKYQEHTFLSNTAQSYAFCSDTIYDESIIDYISGVDVLYHEATYLHDLSDKARERMHSTALEAARIAKKAKVGKLILGHYSSRYKELSPFEDEARSIFPETELAMDGKIFNF